MGEVMFIRAVTVLAFALAASTSAWTESLEEREHLNHVEKAISAIDRLMTLTESMSKEKKLQCLTAVANEPFCECLTQSLPVVINFVQYVAIITTTKEDLKYNTLSRDDRLAVDNTRAARDQCIRHIASNVRTSPVSQTGPTSPR